MTRKVLTASLAALAISAASAAWARDEIAANVSADSSSAVALANRLTGGVSACGR